jgi:hypothetical protein
MADLRDDTIRMLARMRTPKFDEHGNKNSEQNPGLVHENARKVRDQMIRNIQHTGEYAEARQFGHETKQYNSSGKEHQQPHWGKDKKSEPDAHVSYAKRVDDSHYTPEQKAKLKAIPEYKRSQHSGPVVAWEFD